MKKDLSMVMDVLAGLAQGLSLGAISTKTGIPKTSAKRIVDLARQQGIGWEDFCKMTVEQQTAVFLPKRRTQLNYVEPDWEVIYLQHERPRHRVALRVLWEQYCSQIDDTKRLLGYSTFCKAYERYKLNLPASMHDVTMSFSWDPGDVAMIDYSGDPLYFHTRDGKKHKAEIFVGVMPYSNYIFCMATKDQTRESWLLGCKAMLEYFKAVPRYVFLDNSTSLVLKADRYDPKLCNEFVAFAAYYSFCPYAVRPGHPRDKAAAESAVGLVQRRITNPLSSVQFRSLEEVNDSIAPMLEELNNKPLIEKLGTRAELHAEEIPLMKPLPSIPYELGIQEKLLKVRMDYQIRFKNKRFSVPYKYAGKTVRVLCWPHKNILKVFDIQTGEQITEHHYDPTGVKQVIKVEHMPANHLAVVRTKENLLDMLTVIGIQTAELGRVVARNQPLRVARRLLSAILAAAHCVGSSEMESIAKAVLNRPSPTFEAFRKELDERTGVVPTDRRCKYQFSRKPPIEGNTRGADYYANRLKNKTPKTNSSTGNCHE